MNTSNRLLVGLFAGTLAAAAAYQISAQPEVRRAIESALAKNGRATTAATGSGSTAGAASGANRTPVRKAGLLPPVENVEPGNPPSSVADEAGLITQAVSAADADLRESAIETLAGATSTQAVYALGQALTRDPSPRNRQMAVDSLRQIGASIGDKDGTVRSLLSIAVGDSDQGVADRARGALEEVREIIGE
jgi:hypothetical protein